MKTYKNAVTGNMIRDLYAALDVMRHYNKQYQDARSTYSDAVFREKEAEILGSARVFSGGVHDKLKKAVAEIKEIAAKSEASHIVIGAAADDFALLTLPTLLTADELAVVITRNAENPIFCRAADEYIAKHGIPESKALTAARNARAAAAAKQEHAKAAEMLASYLQSSAPSESMVINSGAIDDAAFYLQNIEANTDTLVNLDNMI